MFSNLMSFSEVSNHSLELKGANRKQFRVAERRVLCIERLLCLVVGGTRVCNIGNMSESDLGGVFRLKRGTGTKCRTGLIARRGLKGRGLFFSHSATKD